MTNPSVVYTSGSNSTKVGPQLDLSNALTGSLPAAALATTLASGSWTPTWAPLTGFPGAAPSTLSGQWLRVGNRVTASFIITPVDVAAGPNIANVSLPVARTIATLGSAAGTAALQTNSEGGVIHGNTGIPGSAAVVFQNAIAASGNSLTGSLTYTIS